MPGNRAIFDRALDQSREAARQSRWDEALKNAVRALQEFPQDTDARVAAASALFNVGKFSQALQVFEDLRAADPNNILYLGYIAQIHERQGQIDAAAAIYASLADLHQNQRRAVKTVEALRELLRLRPDMNEQRERLARQLEDLNATADASAEYLTLARRYREQQRYDDAAERAEHVLRFEPGNREAKELLAALHEDMARAVQGDSPTPASAPSAASARPIVSGGMTGALRSQQFAAEKLVAEAIEKQEAGDSGGAIAAYEQAVNLGMERPDVFYSLGLLYQDRGDHRGAVQVLTQAAADPEYALSSHFALGTSYQELGQLPQAAQEYEQTIRLVDLESIGKNESGDLIQMYESAAGIYEQIGDIARAAALYSTLANFLAAKRWGKDRAAEFTQRAKELNERNMFAKLRTLSTGGLVQKDPTANLPTPPTPTTTAMPETWGKIRSITDFLRSDRLPNNGADGASPAASSGSSMVGVADQPNPLDVLDSLPAASAPAAPVTKISTSGLDETAERWVQASERYIEQGLLEAALDACHELISVNMHYFPIHLRMGEIYERLGRPEEALAKYQLLIDTCRLRNETDLAIDVYFRLIELSPDTVNARSRLAELLHQNGRNDEAAGQLAQVAATYFRLGQTNKALEEYRRLLQWAPKNADLHAQYGQLLLKLERYEAAMAEFRKALELGRADDPVAIARLNLTLTLMGAPASHVWDSFAALLGHVQKQPQMLGQVQAEYRTALLVIDHPALHYMLGIVQQKHNQHGSALMEFEQAVALLEDAPEPLLPIGLAHQAMADSHIALGQAPEALEQLRLGQRAAAKLTPDPAITHDFARPLSQGDLVRRMAEAYAASDDLDGAEQALLEARRLLPYDRAIYTKLADVYFRQGKLPEALAQLEDLATHYEERQDLEKVIETLEYAARLAPNNIAIGNRLARTQLRVGYLDQGVEGLSRVAELQRKAGQLKDAVASLQEVAQVHWTLSQHEQARQVYDRITQIAPNDVDARQWLALMYTLTARTPEAIAEKKQIARIFAQQRDYDNAIAELHQIIGLNQQDLEAYLMMGDMLMRREEFSQAVRIYNRMLKMDGVERERVEALLAAANRMLNQQQMVQQARSPG